MPAPLGKTPVQPRKASAPVIKNAAPTTAMAREAYSKAKASFANFINSVINVQTAIQESITQHFGTRALSTGLGSESTLPDVFFSAHSANSRQRPSMHLYAAHSEWRDRIVPFATNAQNLEPNWVTAFREMGHGIAAGFFLIGHIFKALQVLRDVAAISDDILTRMQLLRWTVRLSEWEMYEEVLKEIRSDPKLTEDSNIELSQMIEICDLIQAMYRNPAKKSLISFTLSFVPKFGGLDYRSVLDSVHCLEVAESKARSIVKSRMFEFDWNVEMKFPVNMRKSEMLKLCSSIAEYFDISRHYTNEMLRSGMIREASQQAITIPMLALRLGIPFWIVQSMGFSLAVKRSNLIDQADLPLYHRMITAYLGNPQPASIDEGKENADPAQAASTDVDQLAERLSSLCIPKRSHASQSDLHGITTDCKCATCFEAARNPLYSFELSTAKLVYSEYDVREMRHVMADFARLRASLAPLQQRLMGIEGTPGRPRPPVWMAESAASAAVAFLLSPSGQAIGPNQRAELTTNGLKICTYVMTSCVHSRLVLDSLRRNCMARPPNYVWLENATADSGNIKVCLLDTQSSRCIALYWTPISDAPATTVKEMHAEWRKYAHLMYREWRIPLCWSLALDSSCEWLRAMLITETFGLGTRQARHAVDRMLTPFGFSDPAVFKSIVQNIPKNMTVIQLAISPSGHLFLCKLHADRVPITIPLAGRDKWNSALDVVKMTIAKCTETANSGDIGDVQGFWERRRKAEELMKAALEDFEESLIGPFVPLVLPSMELTSAGQEAALRMIHPFEEGESDDAKNGRLKAAQARELISIFTQITPDRWKDLIMRLQIVYNWSREQTERLLTFKNGVKTSDVRKWFKNTGDDGRFVFFVVPPELMVVQWEMLSVLREAKSIFVHRLVMLHQLFSLLKMRKVPHHANPLNSYYVLDPENNLAASKDRLTPVVSKYNWKGLTGSGPQRDLVQEILNNDCFFYLGHGCGSKFVSQTVVRKSDCRAVVILMGCSSVHTKIEGPGMDGRGAALDYALAKCPCVVGCLFTVTDGEIDKYFMALAEELCEVQRKAEAARTTRRTVAKNSEEKRDDPIANLRMLHVAMAKAKTHVKLPYLTGNAVVAFGIPVAMHPSRNE